MDKPEVEVNIENIIENKKKKTTKTVLRNESGEVTGIEEIEDD